ncbi:FecR family protein [Seonamhaeicola sp. NFXS20]|uniref:FecR family protein n=1 Tax=Seonamhaeicola sp. NFXS20 TaxID=2816959 RepID=UPI003B8BAF3B
MKKLILKYLTNSIDDIELNKLQDWLKEPKNQKIFKDFIIDDFNLNRMHNKVDVDTAFNNVLENIASKPKVIPLYKRKIFRYAAASLIAILISIPFFFNKAKTDNNNPIIVNNNIKTGTDKAILTLEDGTSVALEKGKNYTIKNIASNGEEIIYKTTPNANKKVKVNKASREIAYNYLTIPRGGQYHIKLEDGTQVWLNSESKLKYPVTFIKGKTRKVELVYGEAYFDVSPSENNQGSKFKVITNNQEIEVLGTEFNIKAYKDEDNIYSTLVEGNILIKSNLYENILSPNQQTIINKNDNTVNLVNVTDLYSITSWRKGVFSFKDMPLNKIMKVLSRWYDSEVIFVNKDTENILFTGILDKNQSIEEILFSIYNTNNIKYEINDKTIIFR